MIRKREPEGSQQDQERAQRDTVVMQVNAMLSKKSVRQALMVLPAANFSRLVMINTAHMKWREPQLVFEAAGTEPVAMRTAKVEAAIRGLDPLPRALMRHLFLGAVTFVPWDTFLDKVAEVMQETVDRILALRAENPRRIGLLVLQSGAVDKSNAWLTGFAWPKLSQVVDFVVSDNVAAAAFLALCAPGATVARQFPELDPFLATFEVDLIYVDDMIYSGLQAGTTLFHGRVDFPKEPTISAQLASRCCMHLAVPYISERGAKGLVAAAQKYPFQDASAQGVRLFLAEATVRVPSYNTAIAAFVANVREDPQKGQVPDWLWKIVSVMEKEFRPAIVFAHKLADKISIPWFLLAKAPLKKFGAPFRLPRVVEDQFPFYKVPRFRWYAESGPDWPVLERFTDLNHHRLFLALQAHWETVNAPCGRCPLRSSHQCDKCAAHTADAALYQRA